MKCNITILAPGKPKEVRPVQFKKADGPSYNELRALLDPILDGTLEHVNVLWNGKRADMFVDDIGKIKGLPRNDEATHIYQAAWLREHPNHLHDLDAVYGVAVLFDQIVWT